MGKFLLSTLLLLTTAFASTADEFTLLTDMPVDGQSFILWGSNKYSGSFHEGVTGSGNITSGYIPAVILKSNTSLSVPESLTIDDPTKVAYMAFESFNSTKVLKFVSGNNAGKYLKAGTANNSLSVVDAVADASEVTVSITSAGAATIILDNKVYLKYNATSATAARVSCYTGTSTGSAYLFGASVDLDKCATPVAKIAGNSIANGGKAFVNDELTFSCSTDDAVITYSVEGGGLNIVDMVYEEPVKLPKAGIYTIKAVAKAGDLVSDVLLIDDIDVVKRNADISFAKSTAAAYLDAVSEFSAPELLNPNKLEGISYTSSNTEIATVAADGTVAPLAAGETTITAAFAGNDEYEAAKAEYVLTIMNEKPNLPKFKKVTSVDDLEDGAHYVIAYENQDGSKAMSSLVNVNYWASTDVTISNDVLEATENTLIITLEKSDDYWYLNGENYSGENKYLVFNQDKGTKIVSGSKTDATLANITFTAAGNVNIQDSKRLSTQTDRYIEFNGSSDFRYYSNGGGKKCQLYREIIDVEPEAPAMPQIHPEHADKVSGNTISGEGSMNIKFADVEDHINLYYRFIDNTAEPEVVALDETADNHEGYELYDKENGLNLDTEHHGKTLEVFACDSNTGKHSATAQYNISMLTVGVEEIEAAGVGEVRWFDMQGREVKGQPEKGIYVRVANGKASKVVL